MRSRHQIKLWAVVVIQRAFRKYLKTKKIKVEQKRIMEKNKRRWKAKISGESYIEHDHEFICIKHQVQPRTTIFLMSKSL